MRFFVAVPLLLQSRSVSKGTPDGWLVSLTPRSSGNFWEKDHSFSGVVCQDRVAEVISETSLPHLPTVSRLLVCAGTFLRPLLTTSGPTLGREVFWFSLEGVPKVSPATTPLLPRIPSTKLVKVFLLYLCHSGSHPFPRFSVFAGPAGPRLCGQTHNGTKIHSCIGV